MHLKKIEIHGFKSFADKATVTLQPGITGIVGPNGCGKSNISDAIRWVLGEQSVKSLRGGTMSDVIFAGSSNRKAQNLAEVTLLFDNQDDYLNLGYQEIEITRRLYRQNGESEYLLNRQPCRLKDITNLVLDTGLGRDSLSIISQGNISTFADSRPIERRVTFEEAAGVSKYKKRKMETIRKLERTQENLDRVKDIINEIETNLRPLKRQYDKAVRFKELKEKLTAIEISVLVYDIKSSLTKKDDLTKQIDRLATTLSQINGDIVINENNNDKLEAMMSNIDKEVDQLQSQYLKAVEDVSKYQLAQKDLEIKQKEARNLESDDHDRQISQLKNDIATQVTIYNDRVKRLNGIKEKVQEKNNQRNDLTLEAEKLKGTIESSQLKLLQKENEFRTLENQLINHSAYNNGVKAILQARNSFPKLVGTISELIKVDSPYSLAISTALGNSYQNIITRDDLTAKDAINFLKRNHSGRATFMPLNVIKSRHIDQNHLLVADQFPGFLGTASSFVTCEPEYLAIIENLLGNILIAADLDSANSLSKELYGRYRVVTLDGDVVNVGGSLTGGGTRNPKININLQDDLDKLEIEIDQFRKKIAANKNSYNDIDNGVKSLTNDLFQLQLQYSKLKDEVTQYKQAIDENTAQYKQLTNEKMDLDDLLSNRRQDEILEQLNEAVACREDLSGQIKAKRQLKMDLLEQSDAIKKVLRDLRSGLKEHQESKNRLDISITKINYKLDNLLERLNQEYSMTYEFALENANNSIDIEVAKVEVIELTQAIKALGNVNLDAIEQYVEISQRYEHLTSQRDDLIQGEDALLQAIKKMDDIMISRFKETVDLVNVQFNEVFRSLFGGGSAKLIYEDESDLLETGIDINVQPPGKAIQNISLFSGGEKALIAISCLFAILKVRPVPMCILDEVEAALDLANVDRFARYLKSFSKMTQFIVVTHREGTMEQCDLLYGATMQQQGVTKLVGVQLSDAIELTNNENKE